VKDWSGNAATCTSFVTVLPNGPSERPEAPRDQPTNIVGDDEDDKVIPGLPVSPNVEPARGNNGEALSMALYPNPTTGAIVLTFELKEVQPYHVAVYDQTGRTVLTEDGLAPAGSNELPLDLSLLHSGLYVVELRTETERVVKRVVKE
ncbi:MAG: T9SS type A sorting domain-containing protein, partial [Saprospiraceae bacterium]|nr:T9SS type A sorting domain-containing protein [Saprospiraceae bacterium]